MKLFNSTKKNKKSGVKIPVDQLYNYNTLESREATIQFLYANSKDRRSSWEQYCQEMKRYYDGEHDTIKQMAGFVQSQGLPWNPSQCTDAFIHVETQIDTNIPEFEFAGRDDDMDSQKAKQREDVVRYVVDNNPMDVMNTRNERRMNLYGLAAWKVAFNINKKMGQYDGDIEIGNPKPQQLFFDNSITDDIDEGEYCAVVYRMHKMKVAREYAKDLKRIGKKISDFSTGYGFIDTEFMVRDGEESFDSANFDYQDETLQITEWYFKQPEAGSETIDGVKFEWTAGDIGLVILINQEEVRYVPKYWLKTSCSMYPLSIYCKVPNDDSIYGKSEVELIKDFIDATDRSLSYAQLNDAFTACDVIMIEEGSMQDDCDPQNVPGGIFRMKSGRMGGVQRMGNLSGANTPLYDAADRFKTMMQNTNGNFDAFQGNSPTKATTATEIAILNDRARSRQDLKKADRTAGWKRLIRLIDYTALENFDDDRIIYIGAKNESDPTVFQYNSDNMRVFDDMSQEYYYPSVDVKVHVGDGLKNSKAFTIQSILELSKMQITPENYKFIQAYIAEIDIPQKIELIDFIDKTIGVQQQALQSQQQGSNINMQDIMSQLSQEELDAIDSDPSIITNAAKQNNINLT